MSCRDVAREISSESLEGRGLLRRLQVRLHLVMCRHCRAYARQIAALGDLARRAFRDETPDEASVARLEAAILRDTEVQGGRQGSPPPG